MIIRFLLLHTGCFLCPTKSNSFSPPPQPPQENYCRKVCLDTNTYHFWVDEMGTQPCPDHPWHYAWPSLAEGSRDSVCGIFNSPFPTLSPPTPLSCQTGSVKHFTPGPSRSSLPTPSSHESWAHYNSASSPRWEYLTSSSKRWSPTSIIWRTIDSLKSILQSRRSNFWKIYKLVRFGLE